MMPGKILRQLLSSSVSVLAFPQIVFVMAELNDNDT